MIETMKIKPTSKEQGDYVLINAEDFDPAIHAPLDSKPKADPFDHDGDGNPGGSLPKAQRKPRTKKA